MHSHTIKTEMHIESSLDEEGGLIVSEVWATCGNHPGKIFADLTGFVSEDGITVEEVLAGKFREKLTKAVVDADEKERVYAAAERIEDEREGGFW